MIELVNANKIYTTGKFSVHALKDINLNIKPGEFISIIGHSGSGKSTLMNILGGLDTLTNGIYTLDQQVFIDQKPDTLAEIRNERIGFVFQTFNLLPRTSALKNVELPLLYSGVSKKERKERSHKALTSVGLSDRVNHKPNELSGGQKQRVAIARALVNEPSIILADEPTGNLDSKTTEDILELFKELNRMGKTIIIITHEDNVAETANRMITLKDGIIISDQVVI
ncbi:MAG TPA: ABC transporter ATP-binding protein [Clostridia bacterium]|nr:ABC transporter ATP-binding protein [Clostridia bacterium]